MRILFCMRLMLMNMLVSGISVIDGEKKAYILFEDENRSAEGIIPD